MEVMSSWGPGGQEASDQPGVRKESFKQQGGIMEPRRGSYGFPAMECPSRGTGWVCYGSCGEPRRK